MIPRSFTVGTFDTKEVAKRLSKISTVSIRDTYAVLLGLGEVLGSLMETGYSVKFEGLGTFYLVRLTARAWIRRRRLARNNSTRRRWLLFLNTTALSTGR